MGWQSSVTEETSCRSNLPLKACQDGSSTTSPAIYNLTQYEGEKEKKILSDTGLCNISGFSLICIVCQCPLSIHFLQIVRVDTVQAMHITECLLVSVMSPLSLRCFILQCTLVFHCSQELHHGQELARLKTPKDETINRGPPCVYARKKVT